MSNLRAAYRRQKQWWLDHNKTRAFEIGQHVWLRDKRPVKRQARKLRPKHYNRLLTVIEANPEKSLYRLEDTETRVPLKGWYASYNLTPFTPWREDPPFSGLEKDGIIPRPRAADLLSVVSELSGASSSTEGYAEEPEHHVAPLPDENLAETRRQSCVLEPEISDFSDDEDYQHEEMPSGENLFELRPSKLPRYCWNQAAIQDRPKRSTAGKKPARYRGYETD